MTVNSPAATHLIALLEKTQEERTKLNATAADATQLLIVGRQVFLIAVGGLKIRVQATND